MIHQTAFFISVATSAVLFAFQQAGFVQDCSFNLFQGLDVNHDSINLPRISLFKYLMSDSWLDQKAQQLTRCQMHNSIFFIEYVDGYPHFEVDTCATITPGLLHLAAPGGQDSFHDDLIARSDSKASAAGRSDENSDDKAFRKQIDTNLKKLSRCIVINTLTRTVTLISGKGLAKTGDSPRSDVVPWYIGTDETYGSLILGTKFVPYSPIMNTAHRNSSIVEFPYFLEPLYFPAGSVVALDAAMFAPMDRLAEFFNSRSADDVQSGSFEEAGSNSASWFHSKNGRRAAHQDGTRTSGGGSGSNDKAVAAARQVTIEKNKKRAPRTWELLRDRHSASASASASVSARADSDNTQKLYSVAGRGLRDEHWIEMCSSLANALQPMLLARHPRDPTAMEAQMFPNQSYNSLYLTRPFVVTSGPSLNHDSSAGRLSYWLDLCGLHPPRANMLTTERGSQTYWYENRAAKAKRRKRGERGLRVNETSSSAEVTLKAKAPHQLTSPYTSQAPCDIDSVQNLRTKLFKQSEGEESESASAEERVGSMLCMEDLITDARLVRQVEGQGAGGRLPSDWTVYSSERGMSDLWYTDPSLGHASSITENPFANHNEYYLLRDLQVFGLRYEQAQREKRRAEWRSADGMDHSDADAAAASAAEEPVYIDEVDIPDGADPSVSVHSTGTSGGSSLLQSRQKEYTELLRVLRAFTNTHMHAFDEYKMAKIQNRLKNYPPATAPVPDPSVPPILPAIFFPGQSVPASVSATQAQSQPAGALPKMAYATRIAVRSLFRDLLDVAVGRARTSVPAVLYGKRPHGVPLQSSSAHAEPNPNRKHQASYLQETRAGRKNLNKYPGKVCDLKSALLTDVPMRKIVTIVNGTKLDRIWMIPPVTKVHNVHTAERAAPELPEDGADGKLPEDLLTRLSVTNAYKSHQRSQMRVARSVEEYFSDALRAVISVSADEPRWLFQEVLQGRLGELLAPLLASPVIAASPKVKMYSMLHTNFTENHHTHIKFGRKPYSLCGFNQFIDERDFTVIALSLQAAVRKYLMPLSGVSIGVASDGKDTPMNPTYLCHFLAVDGAAQGTSSSFLKALHHNSTEAYKRGEKYSYLCGDDGDRAVDMMLQLLNVYHDALNSTTQRALNLNQQGNLYPQAGREDPLHSQLLRISMHRPAVAALGNAVEELRATAFAVVPTSTARVSHAVPTTVSEAETASALALNLRVASGDVIVLLYVLPKHFTLAQELVERWRKMCATNVCFVYIKYHITVIAGDGGRNSGVHHEYSDEDDLQLDHYSVGRGVNEIPSPYTVHPSAAKMKLLDYSDEEEQEVISEDATFPDGFQNVEASSDPVAEADTLNSKYGFETEYSTGAKKHSEKPSLRMALLAAAETLEKVAIRTDVVLMCVGIQDCLAMHVHGTAKSKGIPLVDYGKSVPYNLQAPIVFAQSNGAINPYSIVSISYALRKMINSLSHNDASYLYGNNYDVATAIVSYAKKNSFLNAYGADGAGVTAVGSSDYYWATSDMSELFFSSKRGEALWSSISDPDGVFKAKDIHMRANNINRQNPNNGVSDCIDVIDSSSDAVLGKEPFLFNITYCSVMTYVHKRGPRHHSEGDDVKNAKNSKAGAGIVWFPNEDIFNLHVLPSEWMIAQRDRISCHLTKARLLLVTAMDDYVGAANGVYESAAADATTNVNTVPGNTDPSIFPWTANGTKLGYKGAIEEFAQTKAFLMPLTGFDQMVYVKDRDVIPREGNFTGPMKFPAKEAKSYKTIIQSLSSLMAAGYMHSITNIIYQLNRALLLPYDSSYGDFIMHDGVLLKMFEGVKYAVHHSLNTPLGSYRRSVMTFHDVLYEYEKFDSMGRDPFDPSDEETDPSRKPSFATDRGGFEPYPGHKFAGLGVRGSALAIRASSSNSHICDSELYPTSCAPLLPGLGRGPLPLTEVGTWEFGTPDDEELERSHRSNIFMEANDGTLINSDDIAPITRAAREVFGNPISAATYSFLAGMYQAQGPHTAMVDAYSKSLAHTDYFSVANRRKLWLLQRRQLRAQDHMYTTTETGGKVIQEINTAAGTPVVHWVTMASKMTTELQNLQFSASLAGIALQVVGMKDPPPEGTPEVEFNYADKVQAFHEHFNSHGSNAGKPGAIQDNDVIVMIDAYDVLLLPHARQIGRRFQQTAQHPIVFCTEHGIYPEYASAFVAQRGDIHDAAGNSSEDIALGKKFLNSGCVVGRAGQIKAMVHAAHVNREVFRNDQQFYVRYQLSYPDLIGLDYSQNLFFTGHKQLTCETLLLIDNDLSLQHVRHSNTLALKYDGSTAQTSAIVRDIGLFHANNLVSNRQYTILSLSINRAVRLHYLGPDGNYLLQAMHACIDADWNRAGYLLLTTEVSRNCTRNGGTNILGDILIAKYGQNLLPAMVRLAMSEDVAAISSRDAFDLVSAQAAATNIINGAHKAVTLHREEEEKVVQTKKRQQQSPSVELESDVGSLGTRYMRAQLEAAVDMRRLVDLCHG